MSAATWAPALAAWMTVGLVTSGVLAAMALLLHWLARGAFATRAVWSVALLATIGLSVTQPMRQAEPTPTNGRAWSAVTLVAAANAPRVPTVWERIDHTARDAATGAQQSVRSMATASAGTVRGWPVIAQWALLLLCPLASLGMLALGAWSYRTQRLALRTAQVMSIDATTVHVSPSFGPAVFGTRDPRVVIPRWMLERSADEIRLVLQHEHAHIAAGDPLLLLSGCLALALLPWNPFAWFMFSRLRLAIELDCDARVLAAGASTRRYGALLIDLSAASAPLPALTGAPAFSHRASHLERRIRTMTTRSGSFRTLRQLFAGVLATCTLLAACGAELPTSAELEGMDVAAAQRRLARLSATAAVTEFVVDGKASTEIAAQSIAAERIASIDIRKKSREANVISITTRTSFGSVEKTKPIGTNVESTISVQTSSPNSFDGLILLDNVRITPAEMNKLSPNKIESVEIIKGADAEKVYGAKGSEGVIKITTKR
ncbi:MAG: hypothetical protein HEQ38_05595 [Gemmatimonas sp.]|nr:hypothetical protein [Gemmatimonas sp.]